MLYETLVTRHEVDVLINRLSVINMEMHVLRRFENLSDDNYKRIQ